MSASPVETKAAPVIGLNSSGMRLTPEKFDAVTEYDDGFRYELIRGVAVVAPIPGPRRLDRLTISARGTWRSRAR